MSYLDPDPGSGTDADRARHAGAAPDPYARHAGRDSATGFTTDPYLPPVNGLATRGRHDGPDKGYGPDNGYGPTAGYRPGPDDRYSPEPGYGPDGRGDTAGGYGPGERPEDGYGMRRNGERDRSGPPPANGDGRAAYPAVDERGLPAYPMGDGVPGGPVSAAEAETAVYPLVPAAAPEPDPDPEPGKRSRIGRRRAGPDRPATAGPKPPSRAGRNLPAAIGVGLTLGAILVGSLFAYRPAFIVVVAVALGIGTWEMARAVRARGAQPPLVPLLAGGLLMTGLAWQVGPDGLTLGLLATVLAVIVWRIADGFTGLRRDLSAAVLIAVYVPFLGGFATLLAVPPDGDWRIFVTLCAVVLSDTGGYAVGVFLGRRPMAPSISPKKSWEGFGGSVLAAAIGSALLLYFLLDVAPWWGAVFGLAVSGAAVLGDLGESMIKRDLGIKDMSTLLPGHGGLMDRLDSVLFAVPTAYFLLTLFAPGS